MGKMFWFDTETTGTDPERHDIVSLGAIVQIDGNIECECEFSMFPFAPENAEAMALEVNGLTMEEINGYPDPRQAHKDLLLLLGRFVDKFNPKDKMVPCGFVTHFDVAMLRAFFRKCGDKYYGSWFTSCSYDVMSTIAALVGQDRIPTLRDYRLSTILNHFEIDNPRAHSAMNDIRSTLMLDQALRTYGGMVHAAPA